MLREPAIAGSCIFYELLAFTGALYLSLAKVTGQFQHSHIFCYSFTMARPLRLEYAGALYHVTSRRDRREDIYWDEEDREEWLAVLAEVCERFNWVLHAWCQMTNHYHLLVETIDGNLSRGMWQLNGVYTQRFNRRHGEVRHLYQGRYKAILVLKESY